MLLVRTLFLFIVAGPSVLAQTALPRVFLWNAKSLQAQKQRLAHAKSDPALANLERDAKKALATEVLPVTSKTALPPSGDKHDYMSQAPYFWKNPDTKDGLPYIRKDGERNPEIKNFPDHELMDKMFKSVRTLATAYYFTGNEKYAARAAEVLRMWFLTPKTRMNPHLNFAQAIPGVNTGRGIGIIESRGLAWVVDSVGLLQGSKSWMREDQAGLEAWFGKFYDWLTNSKHGRDEAAAKNNHGTWYDVQSASFALFIGKTADARRIIESAKQNRIAKQIEPDGKQPLELSRTNSFSYSAMNLDGMVRLASLGDALGVDLWNFQTSDGRGIRQAMEFLYPYAAGEKKWTTQQLEPIDPERLFSSMRIAAGKYTDENFKRIMSGVPRPPENEVKNIVGF